MTKKRKTKKISKKRQQEMKIQRKVIFQCVILSVLVLALTYFLLNSNVLKSKVDEVTASYISFNNSKTTDMLKISNLSKQKKSVGESIFNNSTKTFQVAGEKNKEYEIVVYALGNKVDEEYVSFTLVDNNENKLSSNTLSKMNSTPDDGRIIFTGKIDSKTTLKLNMWLSNNYKGNTKNISYEIKIKIKPRQE